MPPILDPSVEDKSADKSKNKFFLGCFEFFKDDKAVKAFKIAPRSRGSHIKKYRWYIQFFNFSNQGE